MNIFKKFLFGLFGVNTVDTDIDSLLEKYKKTEQEIKDLKSISPERIDQTDDDELEFLICDHIDALVEHADDYYLGIKHLSEVRRNCYILSEVNNYAFAGTFDDFYVFNFALREHLPQAMHVVGLVELEKFFRTLNDFVDQNYNGRLPFPQDGEYDTYPEYTKFIQSTKPFDDAFEKLVESHEFKIEEKMIEYIRANKDQFI